MICRVGIIHLVVWMVWLSEVSASHLANSPKVASKAASIIVSLLAGHQRITQLLTARQRDFLQEPAAIAVAKRRVAEDRVIPGLQRAFGPARARQNPRA